MSSGSNQHPDPSTLWCTWPAEWPIVDQLGIGLEAGIALFDIGHVGVNAAPYLSYLKTTKAWRQAGLILLVDRENVGALRRELLQDSRLHLWDSSVYDHDRFHTYMPWFDWALYADNQLGLTARLTDPLLNQPRYLFECIMGIQRPHREYLYEQINSCASIKQKTLLNYLGRGHPYMPGAERDTPAGSENMHPWIWQSDLQANTYIIIPYKIYNQSWFSLVVESRDYNNRLITEKLAKPLLSRRVFVLFGAQHHLRDLRRLGFQTFSPVIDESYDEIEDCQTRWAAAWHAVKELAQQDPQQIWEQLQSITIHNQQVGRRTNWWSTMSTQMCELVDKYLREKSI